jgi:signal transduction histidine kinase
VIEGAGTERELGASRRLLSISERELQRIVLDLHDGPVQYMYAALSQLASLEHFLDGCGGCQLPETARHRAERIRRLLEDGLNEIRSFIGTVRPPDFETRDLRLLLEECVLAHEAFSDTEVVLDVAPALPAPSVPVRIALFRVLQEGLSNAYRHGGASQIRVSVSAVPQGASVMLQMCIEDNGAGFDPAVISEREHFGLAGMRDRMEMIGGRFALQSATSGGTTVRVEVPVA